MRPARADAIAALGMIGVGLSGLLRPATVIGVSIGGAAAAAMVAVGCCGFALSGGRWWPEVAGRAVGSVAVAVAMAIALGGGSAVPLAAAVCGVVAFESGLWWFAGEPPEGRLVVGAAACAGVVGVAMAMAPGRLPASGGSLGSGALMAMVGGALGLAGCATWGRTRSAGLVLVVTPAMVVGLASASALGVSLGGTVIVGFVGCVGGAGVVAAAAAPTRPGLALALLAVAASATPDAGGSAALLAAASVLAIVIGHPAAVLAALPGMAAAMAALFDVSRVTDAVIAFALAATATSILFAVKAGTIWRARPMRLDPRLIPAVIAAAWLLVLPGTWTWARADVADFERGTAVALAVAVLALVIGWGSGHLSLPWPLPASRVASPTGAAADGLAAPLVADPP